MINFVWQTKLITCYRILTPKRVQVDPGIYKKSMTNQEMQLSKIIEMQQMQTHQKSSKSVAPDLERTPKVVKMMQKSYKQSSHN